MIRSTCQGFGRTFHSTVPNLDAKEQRFERLLRRLPKSTVTPTLRYNVEYVAFCKDINAKRNRATDANDRHLRRGRLTLDEHLRIERALIEASQSLKRAWRLNWYREQRRVVGRAVSATVSGEMRSEQHAVAAPEEALS